MIHICVNSEEDRNFAVLLNNLETGNEVNYIRLKREFIESTKSKFLEKIKSSISNLKILFSHMNILRRKQLYQIEIYLQRVQPERLTAVC